jgi:hexosaminidase
MPEEQELPPVTAADPVFPDTLELPAPGSADRSWLVVAQLFGDDRPYGAPALLEIDDHIAVGAGITFTDPPSARYPGGGELGLVDGLRGSRYFHDGLWTGFEGHDLDATVDLGTVREPGQLSIRFVQDANAWIFLPTEVRFQTSGDGVDWADAGTVSHDVSDKVQDKLIHEFGVGLDGAPVRFVRVRGMTRGVCPPWHPGRDRPCWVFADEIVVR